MSKALLEMVQDAAVQFAEVISYIIKADVEIVDDSLQCVARHCLNETNEHQAQFLSVIYEETIKSGKFKVIENPRKNIICNTCKDRFRCLKKLELCYPIVFENETIGAVGIICYSLNQKELIVRELDIYSAFMYKIINLICTNIREYGAKADNLSLRNMMEQAIDHSGKGYVVLDSENNVKKYNHIASSILNLGDDLQEAALAIYGQRGHGAENKVFKLATKEAEYTVLGAQIDSDTDYSGYSRLLMFELLPAANMPAFQVSAQSSGYPIGSIIGSSSVMGRLKAKINKISMTSSTVMIFGEKGSGKELAARCIHYESKRSLYPFVVIDCKGISGELFELEFFGSSDSEDPQAAYPGKIELADKGVIFLDNIDSLPYYLQEQVINVIKTKLFKRVGSNSPRKLDVRFILSTNVDLRDEKSLNSILYLFSGVNLIPLGIPALREREEDVIELFLCFCEKYCRIYGKLLPVMDNALEQKLKAYPWPGNVRELEENIQNWLYLTKADAQPDTTQLIFSRESKLHTEDSSYAEVHEDMAGSYIPTLKELEEKYITIALKKYGNSTEGKKMAAKQLGIGIATLYRKLGEMGGGK